MTRMPASPQIAQLPAFGAPLGHHDGGVHPLAPDVDPPAIEPHLRALIGRRIELLGRGAIAIRDAYDRVLFDGGVAPEGNERFEQRRERGLVGRGDLQREARELVVGTADRERLHFKRATAFDDEVEDAGEQLRIDQVAFGDDGRRRLSGVWHGRALSIERRATCRGQQHAR
jgi:hypothetical protein